MIVRSAKKSDLKALIEVARETYAKAFGHTFTAPDLAAHLERTLSETYFARALDEDVILLAARDDRIIGFIQFGSAKALAESMLDDEQEIRRIYVVSGFQNQGVGKLLMDTAMTHPLLNDASNVYLDVWERNLGAQKFYKRYGFNVIGERKFAVASGVSTSSDLIMVRHNGKP